MQQESHYCATACCILQPNLHDMLIYIPVNSLFPSSALYPSPSLSPVQHSQAIWAQNVEAQTLQPGLQLEFFHTGLNKADWGDATVCMSNCMCFSPHLLQVCACSRTCPVPTPPLLCQPVWPLPCCLHPQPLCPSTGLPKHHLVVHLYDGVISGSVPAMVQGTVVHHRKSSCSCRIPPAVAHWTPHFF